MMKIKFCDIKEHDDLDYRVNKCIFVLFLWVMVHNLYVKNVPVA